MSVHWIELPTRTRAQWCEWLSRFGDYCRSCAEDEPFFVPEAEAAAELLELFEARELDRASVIDAVAIVNRLCDVKHYSGTGWFDLCLRLVGTCKAMGVAVELEHYGDAWPDSGIKLVLHDA